jgi:ribosome biogenesis protein
MLNTPSPIPFDFLIDGKLLRTTIDEYLATNGLSSETAITLQYVRSLIPPLFKASFEHDDWVSCVDILSSSSLTRSDSIPTGSERVLSGSYDGFLRIWNNSGQTIATSTSPSLGGHTSSIRAAKFISQTQIASSGLDRTIRLWRYTEGDDHFSGQLKPVVELYGHRGSVDCLAIHSPSCRILSASADGSIGLWSTRKSDAPAAPSALVSSGLSAKRRKLANSTSTPQRGPLSLISGFGGQTTAVIFHPDDSTVAYSASLDHSVRTIDLETSTVVDTRTTSHSLLSLTALPATSHILATGTSARHITLIDPRVSATTTAIMTLRGHTNKVVSLAPDPNSQWGLVSGSHDSTCRVWDLRNTRSGTRDEGDGTVGESVYVIERESHKGEKRPAGGEGIKVFGVAWDRDVGIVSAGEDKRVQINTGKGVTKTVS